MAGWGEEEEEGAGGFVAEDRAQCLFARNVIPGLKTPVFSFVSRCVFGVFMWGVCMCVCGRLCN